MSHQPRRRISSSTIFLVASLSLIYMVSQFLRNSLGVIAPDLSRDLHLAPEQLGFLSGAFFLSFAAAQIPLGMALDRFGPRSVMLGLSGVAILACLWFATAQSLAGLTGARLLMGLGCASFFMAPLLIYARMFNPARFATLTGIQLGLGSLGTLFATTPLAFIAAAFGWRTGFFIIAALTILAALMVALTTRRGLKSKTPPSPSSATQGNHSHGWRESLSGVAAAIKQPDALRLLLLHASAYPVFAAMLGLWGGPYLRDIHGLDLTERGNLLLVMAASQITGLFAWAAADRLFNSRKRPVFIGITITMVLLLTLALWPQMPLWGVTLIFALFGFCCAVTPVITAHGKSLFPPHLTGRGLTFMNIGSMGGAFALQSLTGMIIGAFPQTRGMSSPAAYQAGFATLAALLFIALVTYAGARDTTPDD